MTAQRAISLPCEDDTLALGAQLAGAVPATSNHALCVTLSGELGAGKTTLVRGFLRALGVEGSVRSPSYALLETYELAARRVLHLDLYRLRDPEEVTVLGLRDYDQPDAIWLVEWPERAADRLPLADLALRFEVGDEGHSVRIEAGTPVGVRWLSGSF